MDRSFMSATKTPREIERETGRIESDLWFGD